MSEEEPTKEQHEIHEWRVEQLTRAGVDIYTAQLIADSCDYVLLRDLVKRGCPTFLAVRIAA